MLKPKLKGTKMIGHSIVSAGKGNLNNHLIHSHSPNNEAGNKSGLGQDRPDLNSPETDKSIAFRRTQNARSNRRSFHNPNIKYFVKRAIEYAGALKSLNRAATVVTDQMLGMNPGNLLRGSDPSSALQVLYGDNIVGHGTGGDDMVAIQARLVTGYLAGAGDDLISIVAQKVSHVAGQAGDDTIAVTAETVEMLRGDNGDDMLAVTAKTIRQVDGGNGDDIISVSAKRIKGVSGGGGDDVIAATGKYIGNVFSGDGDDRVVVSGQAANRVYGGGGDDIISVTARQVRNTGGGDGDDTISITASKVNYVNGDAGDDHISINATDDLRAVNGGTGDDTINVTSNRIVQVNGDATLDKVDKYGDLYSDQPGGNDTINVTTQHVGLVHGGGGDDVISVNASSARNINGGTGDDVINLDASVALVRMGLNAGDDILHVQRAEYLTVSFAGAETDDITISREGNSLTLTGPSGDTLQINGLSNISQLLITGSDWEAQGKFVQVSGDENLDIIL